MKESLVHFISETKTSAILLGTRSTDPYSSHLSVEMKCDEGWPDIMRVSPLLDWSYGDIWDYILKEKVEYCPLYDRG